MFQTLPLQDALDDVLDERAKCYSGGPLPAASGYWVQAWMETVRLRPGAHFMDAVYLSPIEAEPRLRVSDHYTSPCRWLPSFRRHKWS